jgi:hypothetical protein
LRRRHHVDVAVDREIALAEPAARIGAVEHRQMLVLEVRRALERHRPADMQVRLFDLALAEAEMREEIEGGIGELLVGNADLLQRLVAERPAVEHELDVEGRRQLLFDAGDRLVVEAARFQRRVIDAGRIRERAVAHGIGLDFREVGFAVAERAQGFRHRAVDDLEIAAAGELLELHEREVGLDARGVAIHHEADRARGRDHRRLRIAEAVLLAELDRLVPGAPACSERAA